MRRNPYRVLGISPGASAEELHDAYREMVKLHHPDRNGGSPESTRRFQEIQEAYDEVRARPVPPRSARPAEPSVADRMATLERELREAIAARERARKARDAVRGDAREPAPASAEDSFGKILGDIRDEVTDKIGDARRHPAVKRVSELIDGLDDLASRLDRH